MIGELPFYRFFLDLREQTGLSLTPSHLTDLQQMILEKYPQSPDEVLELCRILWLQKAEISEAFDRLFWEHWSYLETAFDEAQMVNIASKEQEKTNTENNTEDETPRA